MRKLLGVAPTHLADCPEAADGPPLNEWYAHLAYVDRRKVVTFVQARSLFAVIGYDVRKAQLADLGNFFLERAVPVLRRSGFTQADIDRVVDIGPHQLCKTTNRSVLGSINDIVYCTWDEIERRAGLAFADLDQTTDLMNDMPLSYAGMLGGKLALRRLLDGLPLDLSELCRERAGFKTPTN